MTDKTVTITVSKKALKQFWSYQSVLTNCLGPADDDIFDSLDEQYPLADEVYRALLDA